ncbi:MAG: DUF1467 family protein [Roseovarius sp.]
MSIASAILTYIVVWFMTFLTILPIRLRTQDEAGEVVPGTHAGAPEHHHLRRKALITTAVAALLWGVIVAIVVTGAVSVRDIDIFERMEPPSDQAS